MRSRAPSKGYVKLIYLRPEDRRKLEEIAATLKISHSETVRQAISHFIDQGMHRKGRTKEQG